MPFGADGRAALGQESEMRKSGLDALNAVLQLLGVAREFLAKSERSGILEMGTSDFNNLLKLLGLVGNGLVEGLEVGNQMLGN